MKYIRTTTPTNILKPTTSFIVDRTDVTCFKTHGNKGRYVNDTIETEENLEKWLKYNETSILKQSDAIQDLCDCYAYGLIITKDYLTARSWKLRNKEREIFGCIKTDKGIINVAKMNEKGDLVLL